MSVGDVLERVRGALVGAGVPYMLTGSFAGWKVDFIIRKPREFSQIEFDRRRRVTLSGVELDVASAEDVVIAKLEWAKLGNSSRQIEDVASVVRVQGDALDAAYIARWVTSLHLEDQWREASRLVLPSTSSRPLDHPHR